MLNEQDTILALIKNRKFVLRQPEKSSDLYWDLGFDSLAFVSLILEIESVLSISFDLLEMGECVKVSRLIELAEFKTGKRKKDVCYD